MTGQTSGLNNDSIAIVVLVIGALLSLTGALALIILHDIRRSVRDNSKHIQSLATSYWLLLNRQTSVEDHLERRDEGFRPARVMHDPPPSF